VPFVPDGRTLSHVRVLTLDAPQGPLDVLAEPDGSGGYARLRANAIDACDPADPPRAWAGLGGLGEAAGRLVRRRR
jgi:hypothetical protein